MLGEARLFLQVLSNAKEFNLGRTHNLSFFDKWAGYQTIYRITLE